mgnify:CR=1 FL=1
MAITRYYFPMEKARGILTKRRWFGLDYLLAALLGVITPFCSCSSISLFIGFVGAGIPLGVTLVFLISSPLLNESSLYLFPALFGTRVTVIYNLIGIIISILGGMLIQRLKVEKYVKPELLRFKSRRQVEAENDGAPLYANSVSVIPIMEALVGKGVPLGTALAFMTAIVTVSIPESMILKK